MKKVDYSFSYSNVVLLNNLLSENNYSVYPNPVKDLCTINFRVENNHQYAISLYNSMNQLIKESAFTNDGNARFEMSRPAGMQKGMYLLCIIDKQTKQSFKQKIIFL